LKYALSANTGKGLPRTYKDKRRSVALALAEWPELNTREIASICAVSEPFAKKWRREGQLLPIEPFEDCERRPRFDGPQTASGHQHGPELASPHFEDTHAEAKRLQYLAETWPATCDQCDREFRYDKRQREPERCPVCAAELRECKLCGKPFSGRPGKEFCSLRCAHWHAEHRVKGAGQASGSKSF
jgi:hypothetical protein